MKKTLMILALVLPMAVFAQNSNWERPQDNTPVINNNDAKAEKEAKKQAQKKADEKYLKGAAPIIDGKVQWTLDLDIPGVGAEEIYNKVYDYLDKLTKSENQILGSQIALVNKAEYGIVTTVKEWIDFKKSALSWDRVKTTYVLTANAANGKLKLNLSRIFFDYTENIPGQNGMYTAEEWISDENALSKKGKMYPRCAKFRRKMIDRKDQIFSEVKALF